MAAYTPKQGDFVVVSFDPQSGHEQKGRRPALVVSRTLFNQKTGLAFVCPLTRTFRNYPFHLPVHAEEVTGFLMVEQIKSIDFRARNVKFIEKASPDLLAEAQALLDACIY
ncbi:MAG: type II toxin-antitoxin system PemK/MazF family toxin [Candidatus Sabulitectum sp.]|nr:type II toxin-antitoxin system PemK/MazF family toxin [Candidatus Sabulitectum sp.]